MSSVYDAIGFLAPLTLPAKLLLQEMCRQKLSWDEDIPPALQSHWISDLNKVKDFQVNLSLKPTDFGQTTCACLHHFSDACERGYGTVTYLKMMNEANKVHVSFLLGKARVIPLKHLTIPRLEGNSSCL